MMMGMKHRGIRKRVGVDSISLSVRKPLNQEVVLFRVKIFIIKHNLILSKGLHILNWHIALETFQFY